MIRKSYRIVDPVPQSRVVAAVRGDLGNSDRPITGRAGPVIPPMTMRRRSECGASVWPRVVMEPQRYVSKRPKVGSTMMMFIRSFQIAPSDTDETLRSGASCWKGAVARMTEEQQAGRCLTLRPVAGHSLMVGRTMVAVRVPPQRAARLQLHVTHGLSPRWIRMTCYACCNQSGPRRRKPHHGCGAGLRRC
jgi:hypothetical protein